MGAKPPPNLGEVQGPPNLKKKQKNSPILAIPVAAIIANEENRLRRVFKDKLHIDNIDEREIRNYRLPNQF